MKLILTASLLVGLATAALADTSDRENDLRFDSSVGHVGSVEENATIVAMNKSIENPITLSSRNKDEEKVSYPYISPYGIGPYNDSR